MTAGMNESETRAEYIDPALKAAGWGEVEGSRIRREYNITLGRLQGSGKRAKPDIADYVLEYRGQQLAVIEAKRFDLPYTEGVGQAKKYATKLDIRFTYATNGRQVYAIDMATGHEQDVTAYPSPQELWDMTFAESNEWRDRFADITPETKGGTYASRYYQEIAVNKVLESIAHGDQRILLTLATGTGKTHIAFQLAWKLFGSRWNLNRDAGRRPRILFLADRNVLADQAFNAFSAFPEDALVRIDPASIAKKKAVPMNGSIFFTIFQTFMSESSGQTNFGEYPSDFFDFIIIDECHRGGANDESSWRAILEYFEPAVQLGLTATPKRKGNIDTYDYFGKPVYTYSLKDGIQDGFLTPFRVRQFNTTIDDYLYTPDDVVIDGEVELGKRYVEADFNKTIIIREREEYRVRLFMDEINQDEKTIVFCATQEHALMVRDIINQMSTSTNPNYCQRVTADDGAIGDQALRDFQDNEKTIPTILTTSQKLSTGVDALNVRNIVLMRPINSMIEFKQIIGRGTRLFDGKDYFTIYDFVNAHHLFADPDWDGEPLDPTPPVPRDLPPLDPADDPEATEDGEFDPPKPKIRIKLRDGKHRSIQHMSSTTFFDADGKPLSAQQFIARLFDTLTLPEFFTSEEALREVWSVPETRLHLLNRLDEAGFSRDALREIQKLIEAQNSDLFDVLEYVAYARDPMTRAERVTASRLSLERSLDGRQLEFVDFVLTQYVESGVDELGSDKLATLLELKYDSISEGIAALGGADTARAVFVNFQKHLYEPTPTVGVG